MGDLQAQIERWRRGEVSGEQLLRTFVTHEDWLFFVEEGGVEKWRREGGSPDYVVQTDGHGGKILYLFSDAEPWRTTIENVVEQASRQARVSGGKIEFRHGQGIS